MKTTHLPGRRLLMDGPKITGAADGDIWFHEVDKAKGDEIIVRHHYSKKAAKNSFCSLIVCDGQGAIQLGYGIRPKVKGELANLINDGEWCEFDRMWLSDEMPRFSESRIIGLLFFYLKHAHKNIQFVITYADESAGKAGIIYQATGAVELGGRFVDFYLLANGERLHPVSAYHRHKTRAFETMKALYPGVIHIQGGRAKGDHPPEVLAKYHGLRQRKYIYAVTRHAKKRLAAWIMQTGLKVDNPRQLEHFLKRTGSIKSDTPEHHSGGRGDDSSTVLQYSNLEWSE